MCFTETSQSYKDPEFPLEHPRPVPGQEGNLKHHKFVGVRN